jgi:DNA repair protein RadC
MNKTIKTGTGLPEIRLSYKGRVKPSLLPKIANSKDAFKVLREHWNEHKIEFVEQFNVLVMNRAHRVIGVYKASSGGCAATIADPKLIFAAAIKSNAAAIILSHNHPSGNLSPSEEDIKLTATLRKAGEFLELPIVDHLIVTSEGYYSFADEGLM